MSKLTLILSAATIALGASAAFAPASAQTGPCQDGFRMDGQQVPIRCRTVPMHSGNLHTGASSRESLALRREGVTTGDISGSPTGVSRASPSVMVDGPVNCRPGEYWLRESGSGNNDLLSVCPAR